MKNSPDSPLGTEVAIRGGIGKGEKVKKKVKQGKKKAEVEEKKKLVKEQDYPDINFVQMRGRGKNLIGEKVEKGKKTKKGKFEKEKKKNSCAQCSKEFKFPTPLAEVSSRFSNQKKDYKDYKDYKTLSHQHYVVEHFMDELKVEAKSSFQGSHCILCSR